MADTLMKFRNRLIEKGIVNTDYVFQNDYIFTSPSLAASVVMGAVLIEVIKISKKSNNV